MDLDQIQPQRIHHHAEAGQAHRCGAKHRVHCDAKRNIDAGRCRYQQHVVDQRPEQVFNDVAVGAAAQSYRGGHIQQAALHEYDIRGIDGYVRARADGDTRISSGQCRRVVDAVAHHGHFAVFLQPADLAFFAVRLHARDHFVHARKASNGPRRALVIACKHYNMDPHILQLLYSLRAVVLDGVRDRDYAQQFFILSEEQRRFAILGQAIGLRFDLLRDSHFGLDERLAAGI